jgi:hypothetical protein
VPLSPYDRIRLAGYSNHSVTSFLSSLTETNDLRPPEIRADFLFCNIFPARISCSKSRVSVTFDNYRVTVVFI